MALTPIKTERSFRKRYAKKPLQMRKAIDKAVTQLRKDWRHPGLRASKMQGASGIYEVRLSAGNRLTFSWEDNRIILLNHCNHDILRRNP